LKKLGPWEVNCLLDDGARISRLRYRYGLRLTVTFPPGQFPTVAIWRNNGGYPDKDGCRRTECAFEPAPGQNTRLADGTTMQWPARGRLDWQVKWEVERCR